MNVKADDITSGKGCGSSRAVTGSLGANELNNRPVSYILTFLDSASQTNGNFTADVDMKLKA